jgi:hypothetical protein
MSLPGSTGQSSTHGASGYWIARSSRAMTAKWLRLSEKRCDAILVDRVNLFE